jgi:hypothetical protein
VENPPLKWDAEFGQKMTDPRVTLHGFSFPFPGKSWDMFFVRVRGSIRFGEATSARHLGMKMPEPIMTPTTTITASQSPMPRLNWVSDEIENLAETLCAGSSMLPGR